MKPQHRIETPEERSERGRAMGVAAGLSVVVAKEVKGKWTTTTYDSPDWKYHAECREKLRSSERAAFDLAFVKAENRGSAGVRPAVDLALAEMRRALMLRLGLGRWGSVG